MRRLFSMGAIGTLVVAALVSAAPAVPAPAAATTIVTIQFDDGYADQLGALDILATYGMHGTFFVNSGSVGTAGRLTLADLTALSEAGNEIAGHTTDHTNIKKLKEAPARVEVCGDRNWLLAQGFAVTSFAYPFGSYDAGSEAVVQACGYNSARTVSGIKYKGKQAVYAETIPPLDVYALRVPPNVKQGTTLATIESYVTMAEQHGGGWVQIVFHHLCDGCDAYAVAPADFDALLAWLAPRAENGTMVQTTAEVIGGSVQPAVQP